MIQYDDYQFLRGLQTFDFDFDVFHPTPKDLTDEGIIAWRRENWGTKWSCIEPTFTFMDDEHLKIEFTTAWSPPIEFLRVFSSKYPEMFLFLRYDEPMMGFYGDAEFQNGAVLVHQHRNYTEEDFEKTFGPVSYKCT
jgi:hypothetical protein